MFQMMGVFAEFERVREGKRSEGNASAVRGSIPRLSKPSRPHWQSLAVPEYAWSLSSSASIPGTVQRISRPFRDRRGLNGAGIAEMDSPARQRKGSGLHGCRADQSSALSDQRVRGPASL